MKYKPLVSIITVCFNSEKTIQKTIESVLNQNYSNYEYIIIDGKSEDDTLAIIDEYCKKNNKIKVISEKDSGIYNAMNKGIKMAKGELIGIINSDDWYENDAIEKIVEEYINYGEGIYYGMERKIRDGKEYSIERNNINFISEKMIQHSTCFVGKSIYDRYGGFNENYKYSADYELMIKMKDNNVKFIMIDKIISNFTVGGASSTPKAAIETLRIKLKNGYISKREFYLKLIKLKLKLILGI